MIQNIFKETISGRGNTMGQLLALFPKEGCELDCQSVDFVILDKTTTGEGGRHRGGKAFLC